MTKNFKTILPIVAAMALSACAQERAPIEASRVDNNALYFFNDPVNEGPVLDQVAALNQSADELVRTSRVNGALIGAAVGCGLTVLSASNARNCVAGAAVGGAGGALIGNMVGERDVARRVELVSANGLARSLNSAKTQFDSISASLPDFLAAQEAQLNTLTMQLMRGEIDQAEHDVAVTQIEQDREALADALALSARDARRTSQNLQDAARRGQVGLDWHIQAAEGLANDVESTRSTFSML